MYVYLLVREKTVGKLIFTQKNAPNGAFFYLLNKKRPIWGVFNLIKKLESEFS